MKSFHVSKTVNLKTMSVDYTDVLQNSCGSDKVDW